MAILYKDICHSVTKMSSYNNKFRKMLFEKINTLSKTEHEEIFKIIKTSNNNISYSKNKNGVFFNMSSLSDNIIKDIDNFVNYCISNKQELDDYDKKINECKINNTYSNIVVTSLDNIANLEPVEEDWATLCDPKSIQKISVFIEKLMNDRDKIGKKKVNQKFNNAKKKYAKKTCVERKFETEDNTELNLDEYLYKNNKTS